MALMGLLVVATNLEICLLTFQAVPTHRLPDGALRELLPKKRRGSKGIASVVCAVPHTRERVLQRKRSR